MEMEIKMTGAGAANTRCPNCGAPKYGDVCEYCGPSQSRKQVQKQLQGHPTEVLQTKTDQTRNNRVAVAIAICLLVQTGLALYGLLFGLPAGLWLVSMFLCIGIAVGAYYLQWRGWHVFLWIFIAISGFFCYVTAVLMDGRTYGILGLLR
jgi:hypothetical protein